MYDEMYNESYLEHHGVKGMKWGVRRTAEQLGHKVVRAKNKVSSAISEHNKKKKRKLAAKKRAETIARKKEEAAKAAHTKKKVSEMTNEELKARYENLKLQRDVLDMEQQISKLNPKKVSVGEKIINKFRDTAIDAAGTAGKEVMSNWLKKIGKEALGLNEKEAVDSLKELEKAKDRAKWKKEIAEVEDYFEKRNKERAGVKEKDEQEKKTNESYEQEKKTNESYEQEKKTNESYRSHRQETREPDPMVFDAEWRVKSSEEVRGPELAITGRRYVNRYLGRRR